MVAIPLDKIDYNKVSKYANVLILKEFYPKTKNVSYYLKFWNLPNLESGHSAVSCYTCSYLICHQIYTVKPALTVTYIKQSPAYNGHSRAIPTAFTI